MGHVQNLQWCKRVMHNSYTKKYGDFEHFFMPLTGQQCSSIKDVTGDSLSDKLIKGVTTQEDVRKIFGNPTITVRAPYTVGRKVEQGTSWTYMYSETNSSQKRAPSIIPFMGRTVNTSGESNRKYLRIIFDKDKRVHDFWIDTSSSSIQNTTRM